jgi:hypothetical protein
MLPRFPIPQGTRIDTQLLRHFPLGKAEPFACRDKGLWKGHGTRQRVVPKKPDNGRHVAHSGDGCVAFPVRNRGFINAD